jgi:molybdenum cofactor synthesis domain-containing protein
MEAVSPRLDGILVAVVTVSDRSAAGHRPDTTGPVLVEAFRSAGAQVVASVVPDDVAEVTRALEAAVASGARAVVTTGGTGVGPRDITPEATAPLIARDLPGIPELLRQRDASRSPLVALSRGRAGVVAHEPPAVVVNLPGSPSAVASAVEVLPTVVAHAIAQLDGSDH